ncbi:MAG: sulfatase-like hydrolase/transferase [Planctomycetes bacterium]|nr:sulfatase-like hydrolase/transferase [Planctomycetota bacterium]
MTDQHHLLLITTDQQRFDTIAAAGCPWMRTPHLDWLCDTGIRYARAYADCPVCVPSRYSIMTGRHSFRQQAAFNPWNPANIVRSATLPALLGAAGYQTRAVGKMHFVPERDHLGFQHMELLADYYRQAARHGLHPMDTGLGQNEMSPGLATVPEHLSLTRWTAERSVDFLETRDRSRPFFLWTSFAKPHPPFDPPPAYWELYRDATLPEPLRGDWSARADDVPAGMRRASYSLNSVDRFSPERVRQMRRAYYALVTQVDYALGHLFARLRELGLLDTTTILFTSDHGDLLGDHHLGGKSVYCEGSAHVPFLLRPAPALLRDAPAGGTVVDDLACLVDVLPTLLGAAGLAAPDGLDGRDLLADRRQGRPGRDHLLGEYQELFGILDGRWRYHWCAEGGAELLFDLQADPGETRDLVRAGGHGEVLERCRRRLAAHLEATGNPFAAGDGRLQGRPVRPLTRGGWPGFHSLAEPNDVCH